VVVVARPTMAYGRFSSCSRSSRIADGKVAGKFEYFLVIVVEISQEL
jgi:hypothetical protein